MATTIDFDNPLWILRHLTGLEVSLRDFAESVQKSERIWKSAGSITLGDIFTGIVESGTINSRSVRRNGGPKRRGLTAEKIQNWLSRKPMTRQEVMDRLMKEKDCKSKASAKTTSSYHLDRLFNSGKIEEVENTNPIQWRKT